ncbi:MAG: hypothetical protein POELPBGB_00176 [Bacteroidia bacterium]|nr:hypothetical protein [Bacteroidia bacterium]
MNKLIIEHWLISSLVFLALGIGVILYTFKNPQNRHTFIDSTYRGFIAGLFFINMSIVLVIDANKLYDRKISLGVTLISTAVIFQLICWYLLKRKAIRNNPDKILFGSLLCLGCGILILLMNR